MKLLHGRRQNKLRLVFDTCSILNLLEVDLSGEDEPTNKSNYFYKLQSLKEFNLVIVEKVYEEIKQNFKKEYYHNNYINFLKTFIYRDLKKFIAIIHNKVDFDSSRNFIQKTTGYTKDNGELHSISYILYYNRYDLPGNTIMNSVFITDDSKAKEDFDIIVKTNLLGQISETIDLLIILSIKYQEITKNEVIKFANALTNLYKAPYNNLQLEIKKLHSCYKLSSTPKDMQYITKIWDYAEKFEFKEIRNLTADSKYKKIIKEYNLNRFNKIVEKFLEDESNDNFNYKKVKQVEQKIKNIKMNFWTSDSV